MRAENIKFRVSSGPPMRALYIDEYGERLFLLEVVGFVKDPDEQSVAVVLEFDGHLEPVSEADGFMCIVQPYESVFVGNDGTLVENMTSPQIMDCAKQARKRIKGR